MAIDQDKALEIAESLLWSHEANGKRIVAQHPSPEAVAQRFLAYAAEERRAERERCAVVVRNADLSQLHEDSDPRAYLAAILKEG